MSRLLFVYGTLITGLENEWRSRVASRKLERAWIAARLYDLGSHPGAVVDDVDVNDRVLGWLYELEDPDAAFATLDPHEECDLAHPERSVFVRRAVPVETSSGRRDIAWVYLFNGDVSGRPRVPSGAWSKRSEA